MAGVTKISAICRDREYSDTRLVGKNRMKLGSYRRRLRPSRFERKARTVGIVVAVILLGLSAAEMATVTKRSRSVQKQSALPLTEHQP
jgi:hypothetical protein